MRAKYIQLYIFQSAPYIIAHEDGTKEGFIIDLLNEMEVDFEIVSPLDNRYGKKDPNTGKWNGLVGMVIDGVSITFL